MVKNGGVITEAVSTQVWSGEAAVHVSVVNWVKLPLSPETLPGFWLPRLKKLFTQLGDSRDSQWKCEEMPVISAALSVETDVTTARHLEANRKPKKCLAGQQPGHTGFVITTCELARLTEDEAGWRAVVLPFLNGDDFISGAF